MGLKNVNFSIFFKMNMFVSIFLFVNFLYHINNYTFLNFIVIIGAISSATILYIVLYAILFIFTFSKNFVLYLSFVVFLFTNLFLVVDFFIFKLYRFHINAMVLNILTSPAAMSSIQLGLGAIILVVSTIIILILFEIFVIIKLFKYNYNKKYIFNKKLNKIITIPLFLLILTDKITYGFSSLFSKTEIVSNFRVIPLYQPLTFSRIANKYFGFNKKNNIKIIS